MNAPLIIRICRICSRTCLLSLIAVSLAAFGQVANKRLVLKDGSYQIVRSYSVTGDRVRYFSAERLDWEELPANLVDWSATELWAKDHAPGAKAVSPADAEARAIDQQEMQDRVGLGGPTPSVLPGLSLPDEDGVWALDTFRGEPELVQLAQNTAGVNQESAHNILRAAINPLGRIRQAVELPSAMSKVQLHVDDPALYVSLTSSQPDSTGAGVLTVDTHGSSGKDPGKSISSPNSRYVILRLRQDFKHDSRIVSGIKVSFDGNTSQAGDILPATSTILQGGHWMKVVPAVPLTIGEYALMEILSSGEANLAVWDFRIDPQGPENKNAILPLGRSASDPETAKP